MSSYEGEHYDHLAQRLLRIDVAVLYVDRHGPYPKLVRHWYDEARDASTYDLALPVVAHPPCGPWGRLKHLNKYQLREHALHAIEVVRRVGGVLEHPHGSSLWKHAGLPLPGHLPDQWGGWTLDVDQCRWGHVARKQTWLYVVGGPRESMPAIPAPREPTHWVSGSRKRKIATGGSVPPGMKVASAEIRRRTPMDFACWLIEVASSCRRLP